MLFLSLLQVLVKLIMDLQALLRILERLAPLKLARSWDNVGLLVSPVEPSPIKKVLLTNDLTEPVMAEALVKEVDFVVTYHPLIFRGMKRVGDDWKSKIVGQCMRKNIGVYSPHTAWDCVLGGGTDWLLRAFDAVGEKSSSTFSFFRYKYDQFVMINACANVSRSNYVNQSKMMIVNIPGYKDVTPLELDNPDDLLEVSVATMYPNQTREALR